MKIVIIDGKFTIDPGESDKNIVLFRHCIESVAEFQNNPVYTTVLGMKSMAQIEDSEGMRVIFEYMMIIHGYGLPIIYQVKNDES